MSVGLGLLHTLTNSGIALSLLNEHSIDRASFVKEERIVYDFILDYLDSYDTYPSVQTIEAGTKIKFQAFPEEPIEYWITEVHSRNDGFRILQASKNAQDAVQHGNIEGAKRELRAIYERIQRREAAKSIVTLKDLAPIVLEAHDKRQHLGQMAGIPFGFEYIDQVSDGAQPGDTIAVVGRPSVGKTYIMFKMLLSAYAAGYMPLVISMEMSAVQCARRLLALYASVPANSIRFGKLSHWGRQKLLSGIDRLPDDFIFPIIQGSMAMSIEDIGEKIRELKPDAVYIDGAYLLRTKVFTRARWDRIAEIAETIKKYSGIFEIPISASYQFNKQGPGSLGNIGGSDAVGQLASIVFSIDEEKAMTDAARRGIFYKTLELIKGREGEKGKILLLYNMIQMLIEQHSIVEDFSMGDS